MRKPLVYRYRLSAREFIESSLVRYYLAPRTGCLRMLAGPAAVGLGLLLREQARGGLVEGLGALCIGYGLFYALRPLFSVWLASRARRKAGTHEITLELGDAGVSLSGPNDAVNLAWQTIRRAQRRRGCYWLESRSGVRWCLPTRVVKDPAPLVRLLREKGKWRD
jgi:hypothetical protein